MKKTQKLGLNLFLCLSIVMVLVSVTRMTGYRAHNYPLDATWLIFWLYIEACMATMMASISAFRTLFVHAGLRGPLKNKKNEAPSLTWSKKFGGDPEGLPTLPSATLVGAKTLIYHNSRSAETAASVHSNPEYSLGDEDRLCHQMGPENTDQIDKIHVQHRVEVEVI